MKVAVALALAIAVTAAPRAQQPPFRAETRLVVLHATVRNSRGEFVTNLDRSAFLARNGETAITVFSGDDIGLQDF